MRKALAFDRQAIGLIARALCDDVPDLAALAVPISRTLYFNESHPRHALFAGL